MTNQILNIENTKKLITILFLSLILICSSAVYAQEENKATVKVSIAGLKTDEGQIKISVFNNEENWTKESVYDFTCKIQDNKCECTMENIPYGEYALFVYQDKNSNDELDTLNKMIPTEPFGYSGIKQMLMGPAPFSEAKFSITSPEMEMKVLVLEIPESYLESMRKNNTEPQRRQGREEKQL